MLTQKKIPQVLIIGGMKCGTSSLFSDLARHPQIFEPNIKEPSYLKLEKMTKEEIEERYSRLYQASRPGEFLIDASTRYTMRNDQIPVAERALKWIGSDLKIIYIIRNPIARIISHFMHSIEGSDMVNDFDHALKHDSRLLDFSRYFWQLEPWLAAFKESNIFVLTLDAYLSRPHFVYREIIQFLGLEDFKPHVFSHSNSLEERVRVNPMIAPLSRKMGTTRLAHILYDKRLKSVRSLIKKIVSSNRIKEKPTLSIAQKEFIWRSLEKDLANIAPYCRTEMENDLTVWNKPI